MSENKSNPRPSHDLTGLQDLALHTPSDPQTAPESLSLDGLPEMEQTSPEEFSLPLSPDFSTPEPPEPQNEAQPEGLFVDDPEPPQPDNLIAQTPPEEIAGAASVAPQPAGDPPPIVEVQAEPAPPLPSVDAAFPFSLLIEGPLTDHERERLTDLLAREEIGIREVDLEPQFQGEKILIPRISEFAGVLIVQALRGSQAHLSLGPSDTIYSTQDTRSEQIPPHSSRVKRSESRESHPAESIPLTTDSFLPELPDFQVIDVVTVSAVTDSRTVENREIKGEEKFQDLLDSLQLELRFRAYRKGAAALIGFKHQTFALPLGQGYRISASATAVKSSPRLDD